MDYDTAKKKLGKFKNTMLKRMSETARQKRTISYSELIQDSGVEIYLNYGEVRRALSYTLGDICREVNDREDIMITAVIVHKTGEMRPGGGFYELAGELGKDFSEDTKDAFWIGELNKVHEHYQEA